MNVGTERDEEDEPNLNLGCHNCGEEGHFKKDCNKGMKQTVQNTKDKGEDRYQKEKGDRKWTNRPQDRTNKRGSQRRKPPDCVVCRRDGHNITTCYIFERAQKILRNNYSDKDVRNFKRIYRKEPEDKRLNPLKTKMMKEISWTEIPEYEDVNLTINCLMDTEELYEIDHISASEESADENDVEMTGNEDQDASDYGGDESDE